MVEGLPWGKGMSGLVESMQKRYELNVRSRLNVFATIHVEAEEESALVRGVAYLDLQLLFGGWPDAVARDDVLEDRHEGEHGQAGDLEDAGKGMTFDSQWRRVQSRVH